jgi:hypothetical protein
LIINAQLSGIDQVNFLHHQSTAQLSISLIINQPPSSPASTSSINLLARLAVAVFLQCTSTFCRFSTMFQCSGYVFRPLFQLLGYCYCRQREGCRAGRAELGICSVALIPQDNSSSVTSPAQIIQICPPAFVSCSGMLLLLWLLDYCCRPREGEAEQCGAGQLFGHTSFPRQLVILSMLKSFQYVL